MEFSLAETVWTLPPSLFGGFWRSREDCTYRSSFRDVDVQSAVLFLFIWFT
jgi:hypothetical protein